MQGYVDNRMAIGRRISADARAARPADQPVGDVARLSAKHWAAGGVVGAEFENIDQLFTEGFCKECLIPFGSRSRRPIRIRYTDPIGRRTDGVIAQLPEVPRGPTFGLYSERFLSLVLGAYQKRFKWRRTVVSNPKKTTRPLFEIVGATVHVAAVALRGGNPDQLVCPACGRHGQPRYPHGCLPDWLNPTGDLSWGGQPDTFVAADSLRTPPPAWYSKGDWTRGVSLVASSVITRPASHRPGYRGIAFFAVGIVSAALVDTKTSAH